MESKFKVGNIVRIKSKRWLENLHCSINYEFCGYIGEINNISEYLGSPMINISPSPSLLGTLSESMLELFPYKVGDKLTCGELVEINTKISCKYRNKDGKFDYINHKNIRLDRGEYDKKIPEDIILALLKFCEKLTGKRELLNFENFYSILKHEHKQFWYTVIKLRYYDYFYDNYDEYEKIINSISPASESINIEIDTDFNTFADYCDETNINYGIYTQLRKRNRFENKICIAVIIDNIISKVTWYNKLELELEKIDTVKLSTLINKKVENGNTEKSKIKFPRKKIIISRWNGPEQCTVHGRRNKITIRSIDLRY